MAQNDKRKCEVKVLKVLRVLRVAQQERVWPASTFRDGTSKGIYYKVEEAAIQQLNFAIKIVFENIENPAWNTVE